jgi:hypothetical protein
MDTYMWAMSAIRESIRQLQTLLVLDLKIYCLSRKLRPSIEIEAIGNDMGVERIDSLEKKEWRDVEELETVSDDDVLLKSMGKAPQLKRQVCQCSSPEMRMMR